MVTVIKNRIYPKETFLDGVPISQYSWKIDRPIENRIVKYTRRSVTVFGFMRIEFQVNQNYVFMVEKPTIFETLNTYLLTAAVIII